MRDASGTATRRRRAPYLRSVRLTAALVQDGANSLIAAAQCGHLEVVRLLLDKGADVHAAMQASQINKRALAGGWGGGEWGQVARNVPACTPNVRWPWLLVPQWGDRGVPCQTQTCALQSYRRPI